MIDQKELKDMELFLGQEDAARESLIIKSRSVLKSSKVAIYSVHRNELKEAKKLITESAKILAELVKIIKQYPHLKYSADNAFEEYAEAALFYGFVHDKRIVTSKELNVDPINYLGALSDLTGELGRRAVIAATARNIKELEIIRELIDEVYGAFIKFDLRNGDLRKKADAIKWNLNKVEELLYELKLSSSFPRA